MGRHVLSLGRVFGVRVGLDASVLVIVVLFASALATTAMPAAAPHHSGLAYAVAGVVSAVLLLASLLAHELAHAVVAQRRGVEVVGITLWMLGGVAELKGEAQNARDDLRIAGVGPLSSLVAALLLGVTAVLAAAGGASDLVVAVFAQLAAVNVLLAVFNLIPGAPLDGGRVLRGLLWLRWRDHDRAARAAARAGRAVGVGLVALGVMERVVLGAMDGLWLVLIGWFIGTAARSEEATVGLVAMLRDVPVGEVMRRDVLTVDGQEQVDDFLRGTVVSRRFSTYPVVDVGGRLVSLATLPDLQRLPAARRQAVRVADVARPRSAVLVVGPDEPVLDVLHRMGPDTGNRVVVEDHGAVVGLLTPTDVARLVQLGAAPTA